MEDLKKIAALSAARLVEDGDIVGLGTGTTAAYAIIEIGRRIKEEGLDILGVPTSFATEDIAIKAGISLTTLQEHDSIDICIDGADQVDKGLNLIKGGKGAHTREKIVALCSKKVAIVVDEMKISENLDIPVPVEVIPFCWKFVSRELEKMNSKPKLRLSNSKPYVSDNGNFILDCDFGIIKTPKKLEMKINSLPGVVENGIFTINCEVHVGTKEGVKIIK